MNSVNKKPLAMSSTTVVCFLAGHVRRSSSQEMALQYSGHSQITEISK